MPLGLSLYIDGLVDCRLSSCCEYKYNQRLIIGKSGHFRVINVKGGKECYRCQANTSMRKGKPDSSNVPDKQTRVTETRRLEVCQLITHQSINTSIIIHCTCTCTVYTWCMALVAVIEQLTTYSTCC